MRKILEITLIGAGLGTTAPRSATVTLARSRDEFARPQWSAVAVAVDHDREIRHETSVHDTERAALLDAAEWLRARFGASTTCWAGGSMVTIVAINAAREAA